MTIARAQGHASAGTQGGAGTTTHQTTFTATVTSGNIVVGVFMWPPAASTDTVTITDDKGNTYTVLDYISNATATEKVCHFYLPNITNAPSTITCTFPNTTVALKWALIVDEFSGIDTVSPLDGHTINTQTANGTTANGITSTAITTTAAGDLIYGGGFDLAGTSNISIGTGFTQAVAVVLSTKTFTISEYEIQGSAGSIATTWTNSATVNNSATIMALKAAAPPYTPPRRPGSLLVNRKVYI